jgi:hypothetical protein
VQVGKNNLTKPGSLKAKKHSMYLAAQILLLFKEECPLGRGGKQTARVYSFI